MQFTNIIGFFLLIFEFVYVDFLYIDIYVFIFYSEYYSKKIMGF